MQNRLSFIDNLRVFLTVLVIVHHAAIAYGGSGGWYYVAPDADREFLSLLLTWMLAVNQSFFMSFFFFLAAFFTPFSLQRKGIKSFTQDRLLRLGLPLFFYTLVLNPLLVYWIRMYSSQINVSLGTFWLTMVTTHIGPGPLWFVFALLIFSFLYIVSTFFNASVLNKVKYSFPKNIAILMFIIVTGLLAFVVRLFYPVGQSWFGLQFGYFVLYIAFFVLGILASQNNWLGKIKRSQVKLWFTISILAILCMPVFSFFTQGLGDNFSGGFNVQALFYAMWEPFVCVGMILKLLDFFKTRLNHSGKLMKNMAFSAFTVYIIHPFFVVGFTMLLNLLRISVLSKFFLVSILSISLCFLCAYFLKQIPGLRRIL